MPQFLLKAHLQWCLRSHQVNWPWQPRQFVASLSTNHQRSSARSLCSNSRASDFCHKASLSLILMHKIQEELLAHRVVLSNLNYRLNHVPWVLKHSMINISELIQKHMKADYSINIPLLLCCRFFNLMNIEDETNLFWCVLWMNCNLKQIRWIHCTKAD